MSSFPWEYPAALIVLCALSLTIVRDTRTSGTAIVLLLNWCACTLIVEVTSDPYPVLAFLTIDWLSAFAILAVFGMLDPRGPTLWQAIVGLIFFGQVVSHGAVASHDSSRAAVYYGYYFLKYASWAQAIVVTLGGLYAVACRYDLPVGFLARWDAYLGGFRASHSPTTR